MKCSRWFEGWSLHKADCQKSHTFFHHSVLYWGQRASYERAGGTRYFFKRFAGARFFKHITIKLYLAARHHSCSASNRNILRNRTREASSSPNTDVYNSILVITPRTWSPYNYIASKKSSRSVRSFKLSKLYLTRLSWIFKWWRWLRVWEARRRWTPMTRDLIYEYLGTLAPPVKRSFSAEKRSKQNIILLRRHTHTYTCCCHSVPRESFHVLRVCDVCGVCGGPTSRVHRGTGQRTRVEPSSDTFVRYSAFKFSQYIDTVTSITYRDVRPTVSYKSLGSNRYCDLYI